MQQLSDQQEKACLATLISTRGSVPQVPGASAVFSEEGLQEGTLGGGILEGDAQVQAIESIRSGKYRVYDFELDADISEPEGALCGGSAKILLDPDATRHMDCFRQMAASLDRGAHGILITLVRDNADSPVTRFWQESEHLNAKAIPGHWPELNDAFTASLKKGTCTTLESNKDLLVIEPLFPLAKLVIAGAGHVGKALAHMARLLDFEVTVIDDRPEYANRDNIPDADHLVVKPIGEAVAEIPWSNDTYIVIVTRGHMDDAGALKACIKADVPYIGMIGSRKKIRLLKEKFISEGWSTKEQFEKVHTPIGIEIGSVTVQEIALSIAAELVQIRAEARKGRKREIVTSLILAAGESRRMGEPKMLLPYGDSTILGTVVSQAVHSICDRVKVVLGASADSIGASIRELKVETVMNNDYRDGMLTSVQAGLRALPRETTAIMILLGDQPMISYKIMDRMIERYKQSGKDILIASVDGKRGHPMIFSRKYAAEILDYGPEQALRDLQYNHPGDVEEYETGKPEILRDIDTPEEYKNELKKP